MSIIIPIIIGVLGGIYIVIMLINENKLIKKYNGLKKAIQEQKETLVANYVKKLMREYNGGIEAKYKNKVSHIDSSNDFLIFDYIQGSAMNRRSEILELTASALNEGKIKPLELIYERIRLMKYYCNKLSENLIEELLSEAKELGLKYEEESKGYEIDDDN